MTAPPSEARSDYFVRALIVVGASGLLHFALAHALLTLIVDAGPAGIAHGREVVSLSVLAALLGQLAALYLRSQYGDPADVVRAIPSALRSVSPLATVVFGLLVLPTHVVDGSMVGLVVAIAPAAAAVWAGAYIISIPAKRILHALAIRAPGGRAPTEASPPPPPIERSYLRILASASFAAALLALGAVIHRLAAGPVPDASLLLPGIALLVFPGLAALAGYSLGQSPGRDIAMITRRIELSYQRGSEAQTHRPIVVTRNDEIGELFASLEALRGQLSKDLDFYETGLERAQAAERMKADFLNAVSHELRTPLNVVGGFTQLLLEGHPAPLSPAQAEDVTLIRAGGTQLLELINDILDMSMIESGELRLHFSRCDLVALVRQAVSFHQPQVHDTAVTLRAEFAPAVPPVICDRRRISQILNNLVSNAIKFTERGSIVVRCAYDPHRRVALVRCQDTGVGIAPRELDTIFEEYRQAGSPLGRKKGTGLGLAIARSIAEHHGGSLIVDSTPGDGSVFTLALPLDPPGRPASIDMAHEHARAAVRKTLRPGELSVADLPK